VKVLTWVHPCHELPLKGPNNKPNLIEGYTIGEHIVAKEEAKLLHTLE
jgi:hypothetical protein